MIIKNAAAKTKHRNDKKYNIFNGSGGCMGNLFMKSIFTAAAGLLLLMEACASPTPLPEEGSGDAMLYRKQCGICHSVPHPYRHTPKEWERVMRLMQMQRNNRGLTEMQKEDYQTILAFLKRHARER